MKFMWFVLEKGTPYEACVEPYQHVAPRGATGSRAFTRVFIFSVRRLFLRRQEHRKASRRARRRTAGHKDSATVRQGPDAPDRHRLANSTPTRPGLQRHQAPMPPGSNAIRLQRHQAPAPPASNATRLQRHQAPAPPGSNATRLQRHQAPAPPRSGQRLTGGAEPCQVVRIHR